MTKPIVARGKEQKRLDGESESEQKQIERCSNRLLITNAQCFLVLCGRGGWSYRGT
jgi:hypothetical protein